MKAVKPVRQERRCTKDPPRQRQPSDRCHLAATANVGEVTSHQVEEAFVSRNSVEVGLRKTKHLSPDIISTSKCGVRRALGNRDVLFNIRLAVRGNLPPCGT